MTADQQGCSASSACGPWGVKPSISAHVLLLDLSTFSVDEKTVEGKSLLSNLNDHFCY